MIQLKYFLTIALLVLSTHILAQQSLDAKQQSIVSISAFMAKGDLAQLQRSLIEGLDAGLTINEIKEVLVQLYAYAGFPKSLNALNTFMTVLKERKAKGINDQHGKEPSPLPKDKSKLVLGTDLQTKLVGRPISGEVYQFAPAIDQFLKEHLFGDIFGRDNLDWKTRELATIAALAGIGNVESQLRSHMNVGMHNGLTADQVRQAVSIAGTAEAGNIFPKGEKITNNNFTGNVYLHTMVMPDSLNPSMVGNVTFEPGARSNWHYHPGGQILVAIGGTGFYQEKGSPKKILRKGDVVKCPPNVQHWHGASDNDQFVQIAITNNQNGGTVWLEKVSNAEYSNQVSPNAVSQTTQKTRLAKIEVDAAQLENYKALLKEEIETSLSKEPGVLTLYAVFEKKNPTHLIILERYASEEAYQLHIKTAHFLKYKNGTLNMVKALELIDMDPLMGELTTK